MLQIFYYPYPSKRNTTSNHLDDGIFHMAFPPSMSAFSLYTRFLDDENYPTATSLAEQSNEESIKSHLHPKAKLEVSSHLNYARILYAHAAHGVNVETFSIWNPVYCVFLFRTLRYDGPDLAEIVENSRRYLEQKKCHNGGFAGFPYDNPHLVANYALIMGVALVGSEEAYEMIDRQSMYNVLMQLKCEDGSFRATKNMENDIRATFTAILIADTLNMLTPDLTKAVVEFVLSCQSYDGGFGPIPGVESHGGYVHCAVGIMKILGLLDRLNLNSLIRWIAMRQMEFSGGFQGRVNKLVDSCYSWWIGSACRIIADHLKIPPFWDEDALTIYTLRSAQDLDGGFRDHQPSRRDAFHTFYGLGGMGVCGNKKEYGAEIIPEMDCLLCIPKDLAQKMRDYFRARPFDPKK